MLEIKEIYKTFNAGTINEKRALTGVNLHLDRGDFVTIIGEVIFGKVFRNFALKLLAVAIGAILYYLVYQVVIWLGLNTDDMKLITALIVAVFLALPYWKSRYFRTKVKTPAPKAEVKTGGKQDA